MNQWLTKLVVLFNHWFMPYKVGRGRQSFKCGTIKWPKAPTGLALNFEAKNVLTTSIYKKYYVFWVEFMVCYYVRNLEYFFFSLVCVYICFSNIYVIVDAKIIFNFFIRTLYLININVAFQNIIALCKYI